ncbi:hypothetical protein AAFG13_17450 [Bradyrhizobium sp. B124]
MNDLLECLRRAILQSGRADLMIAATASFLAWMIVQGLRGVAG